MCRLLLRLLPEEDAEALSGDIAELKLSQGRATRELLGLVLRRWMMPFREWRLWVAAVGFVWLAWKPLFRMFLPAISMPFRYWSTYQRYGAIYESGMSFRQDIFIWISQILLLLLFSWTSGYVLALVARRSLSLAVGLIIVAFGGWWLWLAWTFGRLPVFLIVYAGILLAPAAAGAWHFQRHGYVGKFSVAAIVTATVLLIGFETWMGGWFEQAMLASGGDISWLRVTTWYERLRPWLVVGVPSIVLLVELGVRNRKASV